MVVQLPRDMDKVLCIRYSLGVCKQTEWFVCCLQLFILYQYMHNTPININQKGQSSSDFGLRGSQQAAAPCYKLASSMVFSKILEVWNGRWERAFAQPLLGQEAAALCYQLASSMVSSVILKVCNSRWERVRKIFRFRTFFTKKVFWIASMLVL